MSVPSDVAAERALLGGLMHNPALIGDVVAVLVAEDFHAPANGLVYDTLVSAWLDGETPAPVVLADRLTRAGRLDEVGGRDGLSDRWREGAPGMVHRTTRVLVELAFRRKLAGAGAEILNAAKDLTVEDPKQVADRALAGIDTPVLHEPTGVHLLADLAVQPDEGGEWLLEDLIGVGERMLIVATEGAGKSYWTRMVGMLASAGIHPFSLKGLDEPVRVLHVDLENPLWIVRSAVRRLHAWLGARGKATEGVLWHQPSGVDLRSRRGRSELEAVVRQHRPSLVLLGPLYKTHQVRASESHELAGMEVQSVLDDLRGRFGFSLIIEHHAPKASGGFKRDLSPYGSSVWLRWPEYGRTLAAPTAAQQKGGAPADSLVTGRFRGDRRPVDWPVRFDRGKPFEVPWVAVYDHGKLLPEPSEPF